MNWRVRVFINLLYPSVALFRFLHWLKWRTFKNDSIDFYFIMPLISILYNQSIYFWNPNVLCSKNTDHYVTSTDLLLAVTFSMSNESAWNCWSVLVWDHQSTKDPLQLAPTNRLSDPLHPLEKPKRPDSLAIITTFITVFITASGLVTEQTLSLKPCGLD